jgi:TonB family protein
LTCGCDGAAQNVLAFTLREDFNVSATTIQQASILTGRQMVFFVVVGLHALVIGVLMTMEIRFDDESSPGFKPITLVDPLQPQPPEPTPQLDVDDQMKQTVVKLPQAFEPVIGRDDPPPLGSVPAETFRPGGEVTDGIPDIGTFIPSTALEMHATRSPDDYYPSVSLQLQEEGVSVVRICVGPEGRLEGRPTVVQGSGSRRLDSAAVKWANEALTFTAATRNGAGVSACRDFRVRFTLR